MKGNKKNIYIDIYYILYIIQSILKNYLNMSSSNDNNSANNQITQGLDIESEADASMNIPTQHLVTYFNRNQYFK